MYCDWPQLGRCCFCLPLRKGVIVFACLNIIYCAFMIGLGSYAVHVDETNTYRMYSRILSFPAEICIAMYCVEVLFTLALIYGAFKKLEMYIKAYFYFAMVSIVGIIMLHIVSLFRPNYHFGMVLEMLILLFAGLCLQVYLITIVWSLLKKIETDGPHIYDNQLHQIVTGELKVEPNGVYNNLTMPATTPCRQTLD